MPKHFTTLGITIAALLTASTAAMADPTTLICDIKAYR